MIVCTSGGLVDVFLGWWGKCQIMEKFPWETSVTFVPSHLGQSGKAPPFPYFVPWIFRKTMSVMVLPPSLQTAPGSHWVVSPLFDVFSTQWYPVILLGCLSTPLKFQENKSHKLAGASSSAVEWARGDILDFVQPIQAFKMGFSATGKDEREHRNQPSLAITIPLVEILYPQKCYRQV